METTIKLKPLEHKDLSFIHSLNNNYSIMSYWFEEPYESFAELESLYNKHIHDDTERRFIITNEEKYVGLIELVELDYIHRKAELQIIISPNYQGNGFSKQAIYKALQYAFQILNLHKVYLIVSNFNEKAIHIYEKMGFTKEGVLREEFYVNGAYQDATRMSIFKREFHKWYTN